MAIVRSGERASNPIEEAALKHVWVHYTPWDQVASPKGPKVFVKGEGIYLTDVRGDRYIDAISGIWVVGAGHGRKEIADAMAEQAAKVSYISAYSYTSEPTAKLAAKIAQLTPGDLDRVFFVSSGSEAVETAIQIAHQYHANRGFPRRTKVIARRRSYHGSTYGAMSVSGERASRSQLFAEMNSWAVHASAPDPFRCDFNCYPTCNLSCERSIEQLVEFEGPQNVAAILAEPISMPGGMAIPPQEYWQGLRRLCDKYGILLIADEVICGYGRTGKMFAMEHWGVVPDLMTMAKSLSSGYAPIGACVAREHVFQEFVGDRKKMFIHVSTFGGHPVAAAAALKNLEIYERENLVENSRTVGEYLLQCFKKLERHPSVMNVHGIGMWVGFEMVRDKKTRAKMRPEDKLVDRFTEILNERRVIITRMGDTVQVAPPLTTTRAECDEIADIFDHAIVQYQREVGVA